MLLCNERAQMLLFCFGKVVFEAGAAVCFVAPGAWRSAPSALPLISLFCSFKKRKMKCLKSISHRHPRISKWAPLKWRELVCLGEVEEGHDSLESLDIVLA